MSSSQLGMIDYSTVFLLRDSVKRFAVISVQEAATVKTSKLSVTNQHCINISDTTAIDKRVQYGNVRDVVIIMNP